MTSSLMIFQAILSILMIIVVLLQFGKGAETGLLGASDSVFTGNQRGNFMTRATAVIAFFFLANSVFMAKVQSSRSQKSILDNEAPVARPLNSDALPGASAPASAPANAPANAPASAPAASQPAAPAGQAPAQK